jgi:hypothetical protein
MPGAPRCTHARRRRRCVWTPTIPAATSTRQYSSPPRCPRGCRSHPAPPEQLRIRENNGEAVDLGVKNARGQRIARRVPHSLPCVAVRGLSVSRYRVLLAATFEQAAGSTSISSPGRCAPLFAVCWFHTCPRMLYGLCSCDWAAVAVTEVGKCPLNRRNRRQRRSGTSVSAARTMYVCAEQNTCDYFVIY